MYTRYLISIFIWFSTLVVDAQSATKVDDFLVQPIPDAVFSRMQGKSWKADKIKNKGINAVKREDLRYLTVLYVNEDGDTKQGEIICNKTIANDLLDIFQRLYEAHYPIHSIRLVDYYDGNDERSMSANNTSCFNYRETTRGGLSKHARGTAIDINPLWNPCIQINGKYSGKIEPSNAKRTSKHRINPSDLCYRLFIEHGFRWGGSWKNLKDYQHFEK